MPLHLVSEGKRSLRPGASRAIEFISVSLQVSAEMVVSSWQIIFSTTLVDNNGVDIGDSLPLQNWKWPEETWFQKRLRAPAATPNSHCDTSAIV